MDFSDTGIKMDLPVYKAFKIYRRHVQNGMIADAAGKQVRAAQILDATGAPRDAIRLALLWTMPPESHSRLEKEDYATEPGIMALIKEAQRHSLEDMKNVTDAPTEVKSVALANLTGALQDFTAEMAELSQNLNGTALHIPTFEFMNECLLYQDTVVGYTDNFDLDVLFIETLQRAAPFYEASVRLLRRATGFDPEETAARLAQRPAFETLGLRDEPVVRRAYEVIGGAPLVEDEHFDDAVGTGALLSSLPAATGSTVAAALIDIALHGRDIAQPLAEDYGINVETTLENRSIYHFSNTEEVLKAPAEFRQILVAHNIGFMKRGISYGTEALNMRNDGEIGEETLRGAFNDFAASREMICDFVRPAVGKTNLPQLDSLFKKNFKKFSRVMREIEALLPPAAPSKPPAP